MMVVYDLSYDMTTMPSPDERESMRDAVTKEHAKWLATHLREQGFTETDIVVEWNNRAYESIIYTYKQSDRFSGKGNQKARRSCFCYFHPTDWHLMRKCPRRIARERARLAEGREIIAAVNVGSEDDEHAALNDKLTLIANDYASLLKGSVNLVNSYPSTPLNIAIEVPEFMPIPITTR